MEYVKLGQSDLLVSRVCLGCMGFGDKSKGIHTWTLDESESREIIRHALDAGINFFDTAMSYQNGTGEIYLGRALKALARRENVVIATKFMPRSKEEIETGVSGQQHIKDMLDASLTRLGTDYIDLYICHMWDDHTPIDQIMDGLDYVVQTGKARAIGISNCFAWQVAKANACAEQLGGTPFVSVQGHYNLIFREEEREMIPYCKEEGIALTPYSALAGGRLSKLPGVMTQRFSEDAFAKSKYDATADKDEVIILRVAELAKKHGVSMTAVSLAWLLTKTTAPVVGATKVHHIDGAIEAFSVTLTTEEIHYLEEPYVPHELVGVMRDRPGQGRT
jgi:aryl-alcohol dehydrogenase-like predicted oxidoreductase